MNDAKEETSNELLNENPSGSSKENEKAHQRQVIVQEQGGDLNRLNLFDETQLAAAENFLTKVMRSEKGGIKSVNDGLAVLMRAKDLNLPFSTCLEHIHVINGKTGVDVHIIKALLLRAGCTWECLKDYQPLYEYTDSINVYVDGSLPDYCVRCISSQEAEDKRSKAGDKDDKVYVYPVKFYKDFNGNVYREYQLNSKCQLVANRSQAVEIQKSGKIPVFRIPSVPVDYVTEYHFTRWIMVNVCLQIVDLHLVRLMPQVFLKKILIKNIQEFLFSIVLLLMVLVILRVMFYLELWKLQNLRLLILLTLMNKMP